VCMDAWIFFNSHPERDRRALNALIKAFGSPETILGLSVKDLTRVPRITPQFAKILLAQPENFDIKKEKELISRYQAHILPITHPQYPRLLKSIAAPPPLIYARGNLFPEDRFSLAVVGSRRNSGYGIKTCRKIVDKLAKSGITIVSGMARGIDTLAHEFALSSGGRTIAVLGNGLAFCYPPENKNLMHHILENGAIISEYAMNTSPLRKNFPERNGIIAGLSLGVLVVEAAERSGSLITARAALEENRCVYAVPGDIFKKTCEGTNELIRQGAHPVRSADDILEDLSYILTGMIKES